MIYWATINLIGRYKRSDAENGHAKVHLHALLDEVFSVGQIIDVMAVINFYHYSRYIAERWNNLLTAK